MKSREQSHLRCMIVGDDVIINDQFFKQAYFLCRYHPVQVVLGDPSLYVNNIVPDTVDTSYVFDDQACSVAVSLSDMLNDHPELRSLCYLGMNCFIMFFSYENAGILDRIKNKWYPELKLYAPAAAIYLVGVHGALERECVTSTQINVLAKKLQMVALECSLLEDDINSIFYQIFYQRFRNNSINRYPFFNDHFFSSKLGFQFSSQVAVVARNHLQKDSDFGRLPLDILFKVFLELGKQLLHVPESREQQIALMALCQLVYSNVNSKSLIGKKMRWSRTFIPKNRDLIQIYPEPRSKPRSSCLIS